MTSRQTDSADSQSVANSVISGHVVMVGRAAGDVNIRLGKQAYYIHPIAKSDCDESPLPRSKRAPSYLLDPSREIVPYEYRAEQAALLEWCSDDESGYSVRLLAGAGGTGKTRLARHIAATLTAENWDAVEISRIPDPGFSTQLRTSATSTRFVLGIVDYSDRWPLAELVEATSEILSLYAKRPRIRLLFIARSTAQWKDTAAALDPLPLDIVVAPTELGTLASGYDITPFFDRAISAFSRALGVGPREEISVTGRNFSDSVLTMHMAALATVMGYQNERQGSGANDDENVSTFLLRHERRYWQSAQGIESETIERLVFIATLLGPTTPDEAMDTVRTLRLHTDEDACRKALRAHRTIYPSVQLGILDNTDVYLVPLRPDRLGEDFLAECLMGEQGRLDINRLFDFYKGGGMTARYTARFMLDTLAACAARHISVRDFLWGAARRWPSVVGQGGPQLIELIAEQADIATARTIFAGRFEWEDVTTAGIRLGSKLVENQALLTPTEQVREIVHLVNLLVIRGDWRRAQELTYLAADLVARAGFDGSDELRASVSGLFSIPEMGSSDPIAHARRAIEFLKNAAERNPSKYTMPLVGLLSNYSWLVHETEGADAALTISSDAVKLTNEYFERTKVPLVDDMIARSAIFQNHAVNLTDAGRPSDSLDFLQESLDIWQTLYDRDWPHSTRRLSSTLTALVATFDKLGKIDVAIDAMEWIVAIWRAAAEEDPSSVPELVDQLSSLGVRQLKAGRPEAAVESIEEALRLAAPVDDSFDNATVLVILRANRCSGYSMSGQSAAAVDAGYEAVEYADQAIRTEHRAPPSLMALCLFNLGNSLRAARRIEEAVAAYSACVSIAESISQSGQHQVDYAVLNGAVRALTELQQSGES